MHARFRTRTSTTSKTAATSSLLASTSRGPEESPFNPTPVHLVRPPNLKQAERRRRRPHALFDPDGQLTAAAAEPGSSRAAAAADVLAYSSDDSDDNAHSSSFGSGDDDGDDLDTTASDYDSEEEAWPVGPVNSVGIGGWRKSSSLSTSRKGKG